MVRSDFARKLMSNSVAQGLNFGSRWLLNLAVARHFLETEFGIFSFVYMLANILCPTIAFGANFYLIHHAASHKKLHDLVSSLLISSVVFVVLLVVFLGYSQWAEDALDWQLYLLSLCIGLVWAVQVSIFSFLKGLQQFQIEVKGQLLGSVLMIFLTGVVFLDLIENTATLLTFILFLSMVPLLHGVKALLPLWQSERNISSAEQDNGSTWRNLLQPLFKKPTWFSRIHYAWHDVFAIYLTNIPFIFLAIFSHLTALGQFRKAFIILMPVTLLPVVFSQVLLAKLSQQDQAVNKVVMFKRSLLVTLPLLSLPYLLLFFLYPWLYPWLLNEQLTHEAQWVMVLVVITLWLTLVKTYFEVWITSINRSDWRAATVTVVAGLSSLSYIGVNQQLDPVNAAIIFCGTNLFAVILLAALSSRSIILMRRQAVHTTE